MFISMEDGMEKLLNELIENNRHLSSRGRVANYIPALAKAAANDVGICIADTDGNVYGSGNYRQKFTLQSISKVLALMLALSDRGFEEVFSKVGMKPTTEKFNSLYRVDLFNGQIPSNPMINSGAIITTSLVKGKGREKSDRILNVLKDITSNPQLDYDEEVYQSEKETGDKNRAIAYLMKSMNLLDGEIEEVLEAYFRQCSIRVDCVDLANIGLFFANKLKSLNGKSLHSQALYDGDIGRTVISIITTCGMYDFSGEYAVKVGVPSKSGVSGGILAIVPNRFGIGIYGPSLDQHGNSIVGCRIMEELSKELQLNIFM